MKKLVFILWLIMIFGSISAYSIKNDTVFLKYKNQVKMVILKTEVAGSDSCTLPIDAQKFSRRDLKQLFTNQTLRRIREELGVITNIKTIPIKFMAGESDSSFQKLTNGKVKATGIKYYLSEKNSWGLTGIFIFICLLIFLITWDRRKRKIGYGRRMIVYYIIINLFIWLTYFLSSYFAFLALTSFATLIGSIIFVSWSERWGDFFNWRIVVLTCSLLGIAFILAIFKPPAEIFNHNAIDFWVITTMAMLFGIASNFTAQFKRKKITK